MNTNSTSRTQKPAALALTLLLTSVGMAQTYTLVDLGTLAGESHAFALSNTLSTTAMVAGSSTGPTANFQGVRFAPTPTGLAMLPGYAQAVGLDIRSDGRVVGTAYNLAAMTWRAFMDDGGTVTDLGSFAARSINSGGDIAGTTTVVTATFGGITLPRACVLHSGVLQTLPTLGGSSSLALVIDDSGRVGGSSMNTGDHTSRPCLWINSAATDPGTLGGTTGQVYGLRNTTAIGESTLASGLMHATRWTLSPAGAVLSITDLGALPATASSVAHAFNSAGDIVGNSNFHAVLWRAGSIIDLNTLAGAPGWTLENAWDIDDAGRIVGTGSYYGFPRAFLLAPVVCPADFNADGFLDFTDFDSFVAAFESGAASSDFNGDGFLDFTDFDAFVAAFEAGC